MDHGKNLPAIFKQTFPSKFVEKQDCAPPARPFPAIFGVKAHVSRIQMHDIT